MERSFGRRNPHCSMVTFVDVRITGLNRDGCHCNLLFAAVDTYETQEGTDG